MITFEGWRVPDGFVSDGCTFGLLGFLKPVMEAEKCHDACVMHDFLRRHICFYGMTPNQADALFKRHLKSLGASSFVATCYWLAVKIMRPFFAKTYPLPYAWRNFRYRT